MAVKSADRKPEKYIGPDGKPRIRMVPVDKEVVKSEAANASKEAQRHMQGMKDARADMKAAKTADAMTKAMNKLQHHTKAHKKAMSAMSEAAPKSILYICMVCIMIMIIRSEILTIFLCYLST